MELKANIKMRMETAAGASGPKMLASDAWARAMPVSSPPIVYWPVKRTMKAVAEQTIQVST